MEDIGRLIGQDETLTHQIADTFSTVQSTDHSWTEKIWAALIRKDGRLGVDFGLGRYHNRGIMDGFGGVTRGHEQWTVRASRELRDDPTITTAGPLSYHIIEPLKQVRYVLERNDVQPIAFDLTFTGLLQPFFENRHRQREQDGLRVGSDLIRYHQCGEPSGWIELEGERIEVKAGEWRGFRDHSWGTRLDVGNHNADIRPTNNFGDAKFGESPFVLLWSPFLLTDAEGNRLEYQFYYQTRNGKVFYSSGHRNLPDGTQEQAVRIRPELRYDDRTRRMLGGRIHFDMLQGETRTVEIETLGHSGFHLGTALYLGFEGKKHGSWKGALHVEGEKIENTLDVETLKRIHQLRDCPIKVTEGNMTGYGIIESIVIGGDEQLGLTAANSIL